MIKNINVIINNENDVEIEVLEGRLYHYEGLTIDFNKPNAPYTNETAIERAARHLKYEFIKYYKDLLKRCWNDISLRSQVRLIGEALEKVTSEEYINSIKIDIDKQVNAI